MLYTNVYLDLQISWTTTFNFMASQRETISYLVVGVTAEFESFVEVLETLVPDFFRGAQDYLR